MVEARELYERLRRQKIWVKVQDGGTLQVTGPTEAITPVIVKELQQHKQALVRFIQKEDKPFRRLGKTEDKLFYEMQFIQRGRYAMYKIMDRCLNPHISKEIDAFNISFSIVSTGIDVRCFKRAFQRIVERYEFLRTTFLMVDGEPKQQIHDFDSSVDYLEFIDLRHHDQVDAVLDKIIGAYKGNVFNFETGPLFRAALVQTSDTGFVFVLTLNHIVGDVFTIEYVKDEFMALYNDYVNDRKPSLPDILLQPRDFAAWESDLLRTEQGSRFRQFWKKELANADNFFALRRLYKETAAVDCGAHSYRADFDQKLSRNFRDVSDQEKQALVGFYHRAQSRPGHLVRMAVGDPLYREVKKYCEQHSVSMFSLLTSVLGLLESHVSQKNQAIIGLHLTHRLMHPDLAKITGCMSNTALLSCDIDPDRGVADHIRAVQQKISNIYEYTLYPFEKVLHDLDIALDAVGSIYINFIDTSIFKETRLDDFSSRFQEDWGICFFELDFNIIAYENGLDISCRYRDDLFERATVENLLAYFVALLDTVTSSPHIPIQAVLRSAANEKTHIKVF